MRLKRNLTALWLRIPERGIDILAILFSGAGINIMTSAPSSTNPGSILLSGLAITATGVVMTLLKFQNGLIRSTVESRIQADAAAVERYLVQGDKDSLPEPKSLSRHLDEAISDFIDGAPDAKLVGRNILVGALLAMVGIASAFGPVFTQKRSKEIEIIEKLQAIEVTVMTLAEDDAHRSESLETRDKAFQTQLKELEGMVTKMQDKSGSLTGTPKTPR